MMEKYVELVENRIENRNNIIPVSKLVIKKSDFERYVSHYRFMEDVVSFVEKNKSIRGFDGKVAIENIWVDFDNKENIGLAREETVRFIKKISEICMIDHSCFPVFFSGRKGFHVGISSTLIGINDVFANDIPKRIKEFVKKITNGVKYVDYSIYDKSRLVRIPYSLHPETKLYKIRIPYSILWGEPISAIQGYSKECKKFLIKTPKPQLNNNLVKIFESCDNDNKFSKKPNTISIFSISKDGNRNNTLFKQACKLFRTRDLKTYEVFDIMKIFHEATMIKNGKVFSEREFNNMINSAFRSVKGEKLSEIEIKPVDNLTFDVIDSIKNNKYISTTVGDFDDDMDGGFARGNVYSFIGKGGTKKSLFAMSIGLNACINNEIPIAYFNMEMSTTQSFIRAFKMLFNRDIKEEVQNGTITDEEISDMSEEFKKVVKNKFYLIDNNNLSVKEMGDVVDEINEKYKNKVGLVIADSMNSMGTVNDSEAFTAFQISKELKQLAKEKNVAVILINHVTKGVLGHTRDVSSYIRGGEKVRDNCDAYFCLSQCVDKENSSFVGENKDYVYLNKYIYVRFVNKRESGNTIDTVLELKDNLVAKEAIEPPRYFEVF